MWGRVLASLCAVGVFAAGCAAQEAAPPMFVCSPTHPRSAGPCADPPKLTYRLDPTYSEEASRAGLQGMVQLWLVVTPEGIPRDIRVTKSLGMGLDERAIKAVSQWRFDPATVDGKPVVVQINVEVNFRLYRKDQPPPQEPPPPPVTQQMPDAFFTGSGEASQQYRAGDTAFRARDYEAAVAAWKRTVELEPSHLAAWNQLCRAYYELRMFEEAAAACRKQIAIAPDHKFAHNNLGRALREQGKLDEAEREFRKQIAINPDDQWASANLGMLLRQQGHCAEALEPLERAARITPQNAVLVALAGDCYLELGQKEKALAAFDRALATSRTPAVLNNIAYSLANHKTDLDRALRYAENAVMMTESESQSSSLDHLSRNNLAGMVRLATFWDTLGWVCFVRGENDIARKYLKAAWALRQDSAIADHLGQVSEKAGRKDDAADWYATALTFSDVSKDTRSRLAALLGDDAKVDPAVQQARARLEKDDTFQIQGSGKETGKASFALRLGNDGSVQQAKRISGDAQLGTLADSLAHRATGFVSPDDAGIPIVRYADAACEAGRCTLTLLSAEQAVSRAPDSMPPTSPVGAIVGGTIAGGIISSAPAAASGVPHGQRVRVSSAVAQSLIVTKVPPAYPPVARQARIQGTVVLQTIINKSGQVENVYALSGHPLLIPAAVESVKQWQFKPYYLNGSPVEVETTVQVNFELENVESE